MGNNKVIKIPYIIYRELDMTILMQVKYKTTRKQVHK